MSSVTVFIRRARRRAAQRLGRRVLRLHTVPPSPPVPEPSTPPLPPGPEPPPPEIDDPPPPQNPVPVHEPPVMPTPMATARGDSGIGKV